MHVPSNSSTDGVCRCEKEGGVNEVWLLEESGFCLWTCMDHVRMANHYYFVGGERTLVEFCVLRPGWGGTDVYRGEQPSMRYHPSSSRVCNAHRVCNKSSDHYMKFRPASCRFFSKSSPWDPQTHYSALHSWQWNLSIHPSIYLCVYLSVSISIYGSITLVDISPSFTFLNYTQSVGSLGPGISQSQRCYLHIEQHKE
jgi:hypothetical protein